MLTSRFSLYSIDFVSAFLIVVNDRQVYVTPPQGVKIRDEYSWKLNRAHYGTARAPCFRHKTLEMFLHSIEFLCSVTEACLYYKKTNKLTELIFFHVVDVILCLKPEKARILV